MLKRLSIFLICLICICSCLSHESMKSETVTVTFDLCGTDTRAVSEAQEAIAHSVQMLVFSEGRLMDSFRISGTSFTTTLQTGSYKCYAFVNDPVDWVGNSNVREEDIMTSISRLEDNSLASLVMFGTTGFTIDKSTKTVSVMVARFVSKVLLKNFRVDFSDNPLHRGETVEISSIYTTNVIGECPYSMSVSSAPSPSGVWYNKMGYSSSSVDALTSERNLSLTVSDGTTRALNRVFYVYPNGTSADPHGGSWSARHTRVVIEARVGGRHCYYHMTLPEMLPNRCYVIDECVLKNFGGDDPETNLQLTDVQFTVSVADWKTGILKEVVFD